MTTVEALDAAAQQVFLIVDHYRRDAPFRAPETVPEHQARLLNDVWFVLEEARSGRVA